jgi:phage major head subunit gpT-like protein
MALTPTFLMNLESRMKLITERGYAGLSKNLWWSKVARLHPSESKRDIIAWLISTATLEDQGDGGNVEYDEIMAKYTEVTNRQRGKGLRIPVNELKDLDGNGIELAAKWSQDMGELFAYDPQFLIAKLIKAGETTTGYDAKNFFATDHPVNPVDSSNGITYANLMTSSASGIYPGALPIGTVPAATGLANLGKLYAYAASIPQPNGVTPRLLKPVSILSPPALMPAFTGILDSKFIAATAVAATASLSAAGGTMDITGIQSMLGMAKPIQCDELGSSFGGSDTDYYVSFAPMGVEDSQLGALLYVEREAYSILYHGPQDQAELDRKDIFEWKAKGRNAAAPGHPYLLVKCKAT